VLVVFLPLANLDAFNRIWLLDFAEVIY